MKLLFRGVRTGGVLNCEVPSPAQCAKAVCQRLYIFMTVPEYSVIGVCSACTIVHFVHTHNHVYSCTGLQTMKESALEKNGDEKKDPYVRCEQV